MKLPSYRENKSSFLSVEKDLSIITTNLLNNDNLTKLLYYTTEDALDQPSLTQKQRLSLLNKNIKIVPKVTIDSEILNYVLISFDDFLPNESNTEFRDNTIVIDILCHYSQWNLGDFKLRPYKIASEVDNILENSKMSGIGVTHFAGSKIFSFTDDYMGLSLYYNTVHGEDDKKHPLNPKDEQQQYENLMAMLLKDDIDNG